MKHILPLLAFAVLTSGCVSTRQLDLTQGSIHIPKADIERTDGTTLRNVLDVTARADSVFWRYQAGHPASSMPSSNVVAITTTQRAIGRSVVIGLASGAAFGLILGLSESKPSTHGSGGGDDWLAEILFGSGSSQQRRPPARDNTGIYTLTFAMVGAGMGALFGIMSSPRTRHRLSPKKNVDPEIPGPTVTTETGKGVY